MCPAWESNWQPFALRDDAQPNRATLVRASEEFLMVSDILCEGQVGYEICERCVSHTDMVTEGIIVPSKCDMHVSKYIYVYIYFLKYFIDLFLKGREGEREGEKHQCVVASLSLPLLGTRPATQACALTGI